jgi:hypothetical protein
MSCLLSCAYPTAEPSSSAPITIIFFMLGKIPSVSTSRSLLQAAVTAAP